MDEHIQSRIEQYISGEMSAAEQATFAQEIAQDQALADEVKLQQDITAAFTEPDVVALEKQLSQVVKEGRKGRNLQHLPWRRYAVAASIVLLVGIISLYIFSPSAMSNEELYLAYADFPAELDMGVAIRSAGENDSLLADSLSMEFRHIYDLYQKGAFQEALEDLQALEGSVSRSEASTYAYILGLLYLRTNQPTEAIVSFDRVKGQAEEEANWYKMLALLKLEGRVGEAKTSLLEFSGYPNPHQQTAKEMLSKME